MAEYKPAENGLINLLQRLAGGKLEEEADELIRRAVGHIRVHDGTAKLVLTLNFKKTPFEGGVSISNDIKFVPSKIKKLDDLMWADKENGLREEKQDQEDMFAASKPEPVADVSRLNPAGGAGGPTLVKN